MNEVARFHVTFCDHIDAGFRERTLDELAAWSWTERTPQKDGSFIVDVRKVKEVQDVIHFLKQEDAAGRLRWRQLE